LRQILPETPIIAQDIYNQRSIWRRELHQGYSATEALIKHLEKEGIYHRVLIDQSSFRLNALFIDVKSQLTIYRLIMM
jgi:hypothetical protein